MYFYCSGNGTATKLVYVYITPTGRFGLPKFVWSLPFATGVHLQDALEAYSNRRALCISTPKE